MRVKAKRSLRQMLIRRFSVLVGVMIALICVYMSYDMAISLKKSTEELTNINMNAAESILRIRFDEFENLLYQMYTNDDMIVWADNINNDNDTAVSISKMRRYLSTVLNSNKYIRSIMVIMKNGRVITYDQLTSAIHANSWITHFSMDSDDIYSTVAAENKTCIFSTEYGTQFAGRDYYLFHFAHRMINYKQIESRYGVIVISIDECLLDEVLSTIKTEASTVYLTDDEGSIISSADKSLIGTVLASSGRGDYKDMQGANPNWRIIRIDDNSQYIRSLVYKLLEIVGLGILLMAAAIFVIGKLSGRLTRDIDYIVEGMQRVDGAGIPSRLIRSGETLTEVDCIAKQYNDTIDDLEKALSREKQEAKNGREAEIRMLEAQINPHFIYNILDTINWIAIEKDEYDISNAISTLASILRYAISNSNQIVTIRDETEWLKKYVFLQQFRLKNKFELYIDIDPSILDARVHKMIIQPFVENAIVHGFDTKRETYVLKVAMHCEGENAVISIEDNGKGITPEILAAIDSGDVAEIRDKAGIGLSNAFVRLHRYCEGQSKVSVHSVIDEGTIVTISFPLLHLSDENAP